MAATTLSAAEINTLVEGSRRGRAFEDDRRRIVTDATSSNGQEAFFVAACVDPFDTEGRRIVYRVYCVELTGSAPGAYEAGSTEQLMDDYRTQAEAEAIAARYVATV